MLFHADSSPELLSTTLLLDHTGALFVGETRLAHAPLLLFGADDNVNQSDDSDSENMDGDGSESGHRAGGGSGGWHHVAVLVSLAHQAEQSEYRVFVDGAEVALTMTSRSLARSSWSRRGGAGPGGPDDTVEAAAHEREWAGSPAGTVWYFRSSMRKVSSGGRDPAAVPAGSVEAAGSRCIEV